ncbi:MAG: response regulator [Candidatus Omnitrophica bacterium]|nr:response regulator [Candidatus Omnitrophota bacterium]
MAKERKKKVLIVDDEADFLNLAKKRFDSKGYDVITANNGTSALELLKSESPDAVLLDVMMPGLDGLSVLKEIRSFDKNIPVFIATAFSNEERAAVASNFNASGFILKGEGDLSEEIDNMTRIIEISAKYREKK